MMSIWVTLQLATTPVTTFPPPNSTKIWLRDPSRRDVCFRNSALICSSVTFVQCFLGVLQGAANTPPMAKTTKQATFLYI
jgi:hypothetical protein